MRQSRATYSSPRKAFEKQRILSEKSLMTEYGLKNKKELWKAEEKVRQMRRQARELISDTNQEQQQTLLQKLHAMGLLPHDAHLEDVLKLTVRDILNRRLQTIVQRRGYASTVKQARQRIVHGHVAVSGQIITIPSYMMPPEKESEIKVLLDETLSSSTAGTAETAGGDDDG